MLKYFDEGAARVALHARYGKRGLFERDIYPVKRGVEASTVRWLARSRYNPL